MARGFFGGIIAGSVVVGLGLGTASVMTEIPAKPAPEAAALDVPAGSEFNQSREDTPATLTSEPDVIPQGGDAPEVSSSAPDDLSTIDADATQSAAVPQTGAAQGNLTAPQIAAEEAGVNFGQDAPAQPAVQGATEETSISVDPAQPQQPDAGAEIAAFPEEGADMGAVPEPMDQAELSAKPPAAEDGSAPETEMDALTAEPDTAASDADDAPAETSTIGNLTDDVETGRLPAVTDAAEPEAESDAASQPESDAVADAAAPAEKAAAITAFAAAFENTEGKPLMSVVLIDDGSSPIGLEALASFPYPLTFAVDSSWNGAADAMTRYRAAGFEVMAMVDLPAGAQPADTEIAMQTVLDAVPEAVAILEGTGTGLQSNRAGAEQLAPILLESGHGLVLFANGLDTARKLISREGVPTGAVFRDFDAKGQSPTVIRRFLDQAAFKAGRGQDKVIMLGRLRADTISALLLWGLQDRASSVALAPVSAVLLAEDVQ